MNLSKMKTYRVYKAIGDDTHIEVRAHSVGYDDFGGLVFMTNKPGLVTPQNPQGVEMAMQTFTFRAFAYFVDVDNMNNVN